MSRLARLAAVLVFVGIQASIVWAGEPQSPACDQRDRLVQEIARREGSPEAAAPLAEFVGLQDRLAPGRLRDDLRSIEMQGHHPLVAALATYALSLEEDRLGQTEVAAIRRRALGFIDSFWVLGPFEAQGRGALALALPPEHDLPDPRGSTRYAGKAAEIGWRRIERAAVQGAFQLDSVLRPDREAAAYLVAYVNSERDEWAALRVGSAGPVKAWINGSPVLSSEAVRTAFPDQDAGALWLHRGTNVLVLKTVVLDGAWRVFARLTDAEGRALSGVTVQLDPSAMPSMKPADHRHYPKVASLSEVLRRRAEDGTHGAATRWLDYAQVIGWVRSQDADGKSVETATQKARASADLEVLKKALWLEGQVAKDTDDQRAALDQLLLRKLEPWREALVRSRLGDLAQRQHRGTAALAHWRRAVELDPQCVPAHLALATEEMGAGLISSALQRLTSLPTWNREVALARARALRILGRLQEAEAELQTLRTTHANDVEILRDLAQAARSRGDLTQAARLNEEASRWRPDLEFLALDQARLLEGRGDGRAAETVLRQLAERLPDEARAHEELGRFLARVGRPSEAVTALRHALELRPQQPALRRYTEWLSGQGTNRNSTQDLAREYAADAETVGHEALLGPAPHDDDSAVVLLERHVARVHLNGLAEKFVQRIVHVRTERAARDNQETAVRYVPGQQEVEIRQARILRKGATGEIEISEATGRDDRDLSEPWYGLYYDARAQVVIFDGVRAGDVVEIQYTVADVAHQNDMTDYFGELEIIADVLPTRRWDYTLIGPESRTFNFNQPRLPGLQHTVDKRGGQVVHHFTAENVPRVDTEPSMPGFTEVAPYLHVSTYRNWQDVGRWYWKLVADQLQGDATLTRAAHDATAGLRTNEEKVRALHRLVIESTRYVGLEFGIHGYKPYKVTQILQRRFGDCKDKASLLVALLREVGIPADLVLLRTRRSGRVDSEPASLAIFDHAIAYVPSLDIYLDGTAEFAGMAELPGQDQGVMALHVSPSGVRLADTPVLPADRNRAQRTWKVQLDRDGGGRIDESLVITGQAAHEWRSHYQTPGERQERYGRAWEGRLAGAKLESVAIDVEDRNRPVAVHARGFVPQLGERRADGEVRLPTSSRDADLTRTYARLGARRWPLVLGFPWQHVEDLDYELPDGFHLVRAPQSRKVESPFGTFDFQVQSQGHRLSVHSSLSVNQGLVSPAEYEAFRSFLREVDGLLAERVVVAEGTP